MYTICTQKAALIQDLKRTNKKPAIAFEDFNRLPRGGSLRRWLSCHIEPHCAEAQGAEAVRVDEPQCHQEAAKKKYGRLPCQVPH